MKFNNNITKFSSKKSFPCFQSFPNQKKMSCIIPSKPYYLRKTITPLDEVCSVTDNFKNVPADFVDLYDDLALRRRDSYYGQFDAPVEHSVLNKVHGKSGFFLKKTIKETGIDFIWHDKKNGLYLFWGSTKLRLIDAMNHIRSRIIKYAVHLSGCAQKDINANATKYYDDIKCTIYTPTPSPIEISSVATGREWWSVKNVSPSPPPIQLRPFSVVNEKWFSRKEERKSNKEKMVKADSSECRLNYPDNNYNAALDELFASPPPLLPSKSAECSVQVRGLKKPVACLSLPTSPTTTSSIASTPPPAPERTSPPPILRTMSCEHGHDDATSAGCGEDDHYHNDVLRRRKLFNEKDNLPAIDETQGDKWMREFCEYEESCLNRCDPNWALNGIVVQYY